MSLLSLHVQPCLDTTVVSLAGSGVILISSLKTNPDAPSSPPRQVSFSTIMSILTTNQLNTDILHSVIEHVFMPPKLPQVGPDRETERLTNVALCDYLIEAAHDFLHILPASENPLWMQMIRMMELVHRAARAPLRGYELQSALSGMAIGGTQE